MSASVESAPTVNPIVRVLNRTLPYALAITWTVVTLLPIAWMYISSLKTLPEFNVNPWLLPHDATVQNYFDAWGGNAQPGGDQRAATGVALPFASYFRSSLIVTSIALVLTMTIATLAGYAMARQ
jgi:N-acetylglucosamine transport system permease protein